MAQRNPLVGDIEGNADAVVAAAREARNLLGAELVVFPELVLTGYPPEDLLLRPSLNGRVDDALAHIGERIEVPVVLVKVGLLMMWSGDSYEVMMAIVGFLWFGNLL